MICGAAQVGDDNEMLQRQQALLEGELKQKVALRMFAPGRLALYTSKRLWRGNRMSFSLRALAVAGLAILLAKPALAKPPLEAFGDIPAVRSPDLSPDGTRMAYLARLGDSDYLTIYDFATGQSEPVVSTTAIRARSAYFVGSDHVVMIASDRILIQNFIGTTEKSVAFSYNLKTKKLVTLLGKTDGLYAGQSALGNIVAVDPDGQHVYMAAFMGPTGSEPSYDVLKVNLDTGKSVRGSSILGEKTTSRWVINSKGRPIAREDYDERRQIHTINIYDNGRAREIFREEAELVTEGIVGATKDGDLLISSEGDTDFRGTYSMSRVDGARKPLAGRPNADVEATLLDPDDKTLVGLIYGGMFASYDMVDPALDADLDAAISAIPGAAVQLVSWTKDWSKLLLQVSGGMRAERYMLFDRATKKLSLITDVRPDIKPEDVGEVVTIEYKARDGMKIPALVTWPAGVPKQQRKNLPMVVLPHGGPESYVAVGFDWLAQFLANEGYVVLQPNFRGSDGFGSAFREAGHKEWGRKSQDDISDGAKALASMGWADPARTCIVGWSYGGYAALAGGAFTPELYKCVVSIAGVSDLRGMLATERQHYGKNSRAYSYWKDVIGDPDADAEAIDTVSPSLHAANFKAPVLLVHGSEDTNVDVRQSDKMESALKNAGKDVYYVRIKGDDHGLVDNDSRRRMLSTLGDFLKKHIGGPN